MRLQNVGFYVQTATAKNITIKKKRSENAPNFFSKMVAGAGIEPATLGL